jgi:GAF domain-containing protein
MKIEASQVRKLVISEVARLDPITVFLEEMPVFRGKMIVECYGQSWSAYWGNMGTTLRLFIQQASADYITGCLARPGMRRDIYDPDGLQSQLKKEVLRLRRVHYLTHLEAREMWDEIEGMDFEHPFHIRSKLLVELLGDDWHCALPEKINPDWAYLLRIVEAIKQAMEESVCPTP